MDLDVKMKAVIIGACFLIVSEANITLEHSLYLRDETLSVYDICTGIWHVECLLCFAN